MGGEDHFEIDHHRPVSKFKHLINEYSNLYYACHGCNRKGAKGENWPSKELYDDGFRFFDPIMENAYELHIRETHSGRLIDKTNVGKYSISVLRLNRDGLINLRRQRRIMRTILKKELKRLLSILNEGKLLHHQPSPEIHTRLNLVRSKLQSPPILSLIPDWWNQ